MRIGKSIDLNKLEEDNQGVNYVGRTEENNGITSRVKQVDQEAYTGSCITVPMVGNALKSTYQTESFYTSQNILILRSDRLNKYTAMFFNSIIRQDMYRFTYGRTLSKERFNELEIMLPSIILESGKVVPDYVFMEQYVKTLKYSKVL